MTEISRIDASPEKRLIARQAARLLLEVGAILFNAETPFIFTSGWASPVYTDMRKIIAFPRARAALINFAVTTITREIGFESLDVIAGGETDELFVRDAGEVAARLKQAPSFTVQGKTF